MCARAPPFLAGDGEAEPPDAEGAALELEGMDQPEGPRVTEDVDSAWTVLQEEYRPGGRYSWILEGEEELTAAPSAQSAVLAALLLGLYHPRISVVTVSLRQLDSLIRHGWFLKGEFVCVSESCVDPHLLPSPALSCTLTRGVCVCVCLSQPTGPWAALSLAWPLIVTTARSCWK